MSQPLALYTSGTMHGSLAEMDIRGISGDLKINSRPMLSSAESSWQADTLGDHSWGNDVTTQRTNGR